ncbi:MAG: hypothetical protein ACTTK4_06160, partial [Porphyromonas gingivalis]
PHKGSNIVASGVFRKQGSGAALAYYRAYTDRLAIVLEGVVCLFVQASGGQDSLSLRTRIMGFLGRIIFSPDFSMN